MSNGEVERAEVDVEGAERVDGARVSTAGLPTLAESNADGVPQESVAKSLYENLSDSFRGECISGDPPMDWGDGALSDRCACGFGSGFGCGCDGFFGCD